ncbi:MAG: thioredoxin family protein [Archaeoglobaceae archaeon]
MRYYPLVALTLIILALTLTCCTQNEGENESILSPVDNHNPTPAPTPPQTYNPAPEVYFYYLPKCPSCEKIKPYMEKMRQEVVDAQFEFCDVSNYTSCSNKSLNVANNSDLKGMPTVILVHGRNTTIMLGWKEVGNLSQSLRDLGIESPNVTYRYRTYEIEDCVNCHNQRDLPPPSTYNCTYCCHNN